MMRIACALLLAGCAHGEVKGVMFDDFTYASTRDLAAHGWTMRTAPGWPGVPGARWTVDAFSLHDDPADGKNRVLRLTSSSDGARTHQAQLCHERKYLEGSYAARVRFTDAPAAGKNGDRVVETFYFVSPQRAPMDPDYSEWISSTCRTADSARPAPSCS